MKTSLTSFSFPVNWLNGVLLPMAAAIYHPVVRGYLDTRKLTEMTEALTVALATVGRNVLDALTGCDVDLTRMVYLFSFGVATRSKPPPHFPDCLGGPRNRGECHLLPSFADQGSRHVGPYAVWLDCLSIEGVV